MLNTSASNTVTHRPWRGISYDAGIADRRVMIVGNSHWLSRDEQDCDDVTETVIRKVISGEYNIAFFNHIRDYFGFKEHGEFWGRVVFMNYAPWAIGEGDKRYANLTGSMVTAAKSRLSAEVEQNNPDMVFVFSKKIQWALPEMSAHDAVLPLPGARIGLLPTHQAKVLLLRHTQGAPKRKMIDTIAAALRLAR